MDENPYESPRGNVDGTRSIRVRIRWWPIVVFIVFAALVAAVLLPAFQPGREVEGEREYFERRRQRREAEQTKSP
jgi:hypothetical protein